MLKFVGYSPGSSGISHITPSAMNTLDIIILVILLPFLVQGIRKGFISQLTALLSIILGIWMAFKFSSLVVEWMKPQLHLSDQVLKVISFIIILIVVVLVLYLVGKLLEKMLKLVMLGWMDKLLGVILSLLKGLVVIGLLIVVFNSLNTNFHLVADEKLEGSVLYPALKDATYTIFPYLKEWLFPAGSPAVDPDSVEAASEALSSMTI